MHNNVYLNKEQFSQMERSCKNTILSSLFYRNDYHSHMYIKSDRSCMTSCSNEFHRLQKSLEAVSLTI